ncbi:family 1 glycosylhydrolase, partial [Streptococcus pyogenes]
IANYIHDETDAKTGGMLAYSEAYPASSRPEDVKVAREWDEFVNHTLMECYVNGAYSVHQMTYAKNHGIDMKIVEGEMEAIAR